MEIHDDDKILSYVKRVKNYIRDNQLLDVISEENSFGQVIELLSKDKPSSELKKIQPTEQMQKFFDINTALFEEAKTYRWGEISKVYLTT